MAVLILSGCARSPGLLVKSAETKYKQSDYQGVITDCSEAIRLNPRPDLARPVFLLARDEALLPHLGEDQPAAFERAGRSPVVDPIHQLQNYINAGLPVALPCAIDAQWCDHSSPGMWCISRIEIRTWASMTI